MRLIDADALDYLCFKIIEDDYNQGAAPTSWAQAYSAFQDDIDNAPTIEAEPVRRGRWLTEYGDHIYAGLRPMFICCSECGMVTAVEWHYCPNCGAKMDGGEERWNK